MTDDDSLIDDGPAGDAAREAFVEGPSDPTVCLKLAKACDETGQSGIGLWFLAHGIAASGDAAPEFSGTYCELLSRMIVPADGGRGCQGYEILFPALDRADEGFCYQALQAMAVAVALDPGPALSVVAQTRLADSPSFQAWALNVHLFANDLDAAHASAERLSGVDAKGGWALRSLSRLAMIDGDYPLAEKLLGRFQELHGEFRQVVLEMSTALYCQGRVDEARTYMARSFELVDPEMINQRLAQIGPLGEQLAEAMANNIADGGDMGRIGASIHYTDEERVRGFWEEHKKYCGPENSFRSIPGYTNREMFSRVEKLFAERPALRKVVNYGTLCGVLEDRLAERFPDKVWAGYDISEIASGLNKAEYRRDNLMFSSNLDDLLGTLSDIDGETILTHCRTADVMLPEALKQVYRGCHAAGVELILAAEYFSYSFPLQQFPDFEAGGVDTVHLDGIVMMHNYDRIMPECGYRIISSTFGPVPLMVSVSGEGMFGDQMIHYVLAERETGSSE
ncbi:MAG: tetratricopeptide repeat protein [Alphaproteobacteria bacterium]